MKKGFILPTVLILMSMLVGVSLVLNQISRDKTRALKSQETSFYIKKEITVTLEDEDQDPESEPPFYDGVNLTSSDGRVSFTRSSVRRSPEGKLWSSPGQIYVSEGGSCIDVGGTPGNNFKCKGTEEFFPCKYSFNLPKEQFSDNMRILDSLDIRGNREPSDYSNILPGEYKFSNPLNGPSYMYFSGLGNYEIAAFPFAPNREAVFSGTGSYMFDNIDIKDGSKQNSIEYNLHFNGGDGLRVYVKDDVETGSAGKIFFGRGEIRINELDVDSSDGEVKFDGGRVFIDEMTVEPDTKVVMNEGVYWIKELEFKANSSLKVEGRVKIYTEDLEIGSGVNLNTGGDPSNLLIIKYSDEDEEKEVKYSGARIDGFLYSEGDVELYGARVTGSITARSVKLVDSQIYFDKDAASQMTRYSIENEGGMW